MSYEYDFFSTALFDSITIDCILCLLYVFLSTGFIFISGLCLSHFFWLPYSWYLNAFIGVFRLLTALHFSVSFYCLLNSSPLFSFQNIYSWCSEFCFSLIQVVLQRTLFRILVYLLLVGLQPHLIHFCGFDSLPLLLQFTISNGL